MADGWTDDVTEVPQDLSLHDGVDPAHDEHGHAAAFDGEVLDNEEPAADAAPAPKKRGNGARIAVLVFGVVVLGIVGMLGMKLVAGSHSQAQVEEVPPEPQPTGNANAGSAADSMLAGAQQPAAQVGMLGDPASSPTGGFPMGSASAPAAPSSQGASAPAAAAAVAASTAAVATQVSSTQSAMAASPTTGPAATAGGDGRVASLEQRMDKVEGRVDELARRKAKPSGAASTTDSGTTAKAAQDRSAKRHSSTQTAAKSKGAKEASPAVAPKEPKEEVIESNELASYRLQAVYPVQGADARAWIFDGQVTRVVARGDYLGAARVLEVQRDKVLTTKGVVR